MRAREQASVLAGKRGSRRLTSTCLARMSCGNKLSNVRTSVLRSGEGLTSFNKNNRVNFSGDKKLK